MLKGAATPVTTAAGLTDILVNATAVVYTQTFPLKLAQFFGIAARATSVLGTPGIKIELEEGPVLPTTEGAAETSKFVEPDGFSDILDISDELMHIKTVAPIPMSYGRYKITGSGANPADTIVTIWNFMQEPT